MRCSPSSTAGSDGRRRGPRRQGLSANDPISFMSRGIIGATRPGVPSLREPELGGPSCAVELLIRPLRASTDVAVSSSLGGEKGGIVPILDFEDSPRPKNEVTFAEGRLTTRTYATRSFVTQFGQDVGHPSRYVYRVFDEALIDDDNEYDWTSEVVYTTPGGRKQLQLQVARTAGAVRKLRIQKVPTTGDLTKLETVLELNREQATRLIDMLRALDSIPVEGENSVYVDDQLLRDVFADPSAMANIYSRDPERFRALIQTDADAEDVIALQHRRHIVASMRAWLENDDAFDAAAAEAHGPERAWQGLLEANPWILGIGLGGQLLTSWNRDRLEQAVVGRSIKGVGKRADALLRTTGIIRSLAFAEIKHHRTKLVEDEYRAGCWCPSSDVAGAVTQAQQTVHLACRDLGEYLQDTSPEGELLQSGTFLLRPRSFVIVGTLKQLTGSIGGAHPDKFRSFELFRRNLQEPEVVTFDELLARAEWHVESAAQASARIDDDPPDAPPAVTAESEGGRGGRYETAAADPWPAGPDPWGMPADDPW
jgi:hypothetical protein